MEYDLMEKNMLAVNGRALLHRGKIGLTVVEILLHERTLSNRAIYQSLKIKITKKLPYFFIVSFRE